jgi:hypothetical protein
MNVQLTRYQEVFGRHADGITSQPHSGPPGAGQLLCVGASKEVSSEGTHASSATGANAAVFRMLPTLAAVAVSLGACHAAALRTPAHATV